MRAPNRPILERRHPREYLDGVDVFIGKQLGALEAHLVSAKTTGLAKAPSDAAVSMTLRAFRVAYIEFRQLMEKPGRHLNRAHAELEACIDEIEELVSRCGTTVLVRMRGDDPPLGRQR